MAAAYPVPEGRMIPAFGPNDDFTFGLFMAVAVAGAVVLLIQQWRP